MRVAVVLLAAGAISAPALGAPKSRPDSPLITDVRKCQRIVEDAARLACFDRSVAVLATAQARGDISFVDRQGMREVRRSLFGFSVPKLPFFSSPKGEQEPKVLVTTLASFRELGHDFYRFTVQDPESTWETLDAAFIGSPKAGDKVTIKKGSLGNYWVQFGREREVSAHRIR